MGNFIKRVKKHIEARIGEPTTRTDGSRKIYSTENLELAYDNNKIKPAHGVRIALFVPVLE